jgi:hypothetical protein
MRFVFKLKAGTNMVKQLSIIMAYEQYIALLIS